MNKKEKIELLCQLYAEITSMAVITVGVVSRYKGWTYGTTDGLMGDLAAAGVIERGSNMHDEWRVIVPDYATAKQKITDYIEGGPNNPANWERRFVVHDVSDKKAAGDRLMDYLNSKKDYAPEPLEGNFFPLSPGEYPKLTVDMGEHPAFGEDVSGPIKCTPELRWLRVMNSRTLQQKWIKADGSEEWIDVPEILEIGK